MSTNLNEKTSEELIKIIENAKTDEEIIGTIHSENADDDVLDMAFNSPLVNEVTLRKIIESEDLFSYASLLVRVIEHPKADSSIIDSAYEKAKQLHKKAKEQGDEDMEIDYSSRIIQIQMGILGIFGVINKKVGPEILIKIIEDITFLDFNNKNDKLFRAINHPNANSEVLDAAYEKIKNFGSNMGNEEFRTILREHIMFNENINRELLIKIIKECSYEMILFDIIYYFEDFNVLAETYKRMKEISDSNKERILSTAVCIVGNFNNVVGELIAPEITAKIKVSPELLIEIINDTENKGVIYNALKHQNANSEVFTAGYKRAKDLYKENNLSRIINTILSFDKKKSIVSPETLGDMANDIKEPLELRNILSHNNVSAQVIYDGFNKFISSNDQRLIMGFFRNFPYLMLLHGPAEDFEAISYKEVFNTQIAKDVAMLYFRDNQGKFSSSVLERFSKECNVSIDFKTFEIPQNNAGYNRN